MSHPSMLSPLLIQAALSMQWLASKSPPAPAPICRLRSNLVMASESDIITVINVTVLIIIMV